MMDKVNNLTHEVLMTSMADVVAIPVILSPAMIFTQKTDVTEQQVGDIDVKDIHRVKWMRIQFCLDKIETRLHSHPSTTDVNGIS